MPAKPRKATSTQRELLTALVSRNCVVSVGHFNDVIRISDGEIVYIGKCDGSPTVDACVKSGWLAKVDVPDLVRAKRPSAYYFLGVTDSGKAAVSAT